MVHLSNTLYSKNSIIERLHRYFFVYFKNCSVPTTETLVVYCIINTLYIILDNARYQKCKAVTELATHLGINLVYIPPYSPNLNLIERLWKHVKGKLRSKYYSEFDSFQEAINSFVDNVDKKDKGKIDRLIGEKIQLFDDVAIAGQCKMTKPQEKVA